VFVGWIFYGLGAAAIFPIRRANGSKPIPYRVPGYPWTPILFVLAAGAIVGNAVYAAFQDPDQFRNLKFALALLVAGIPAYLFWRKRPTRSSA
jgi:APA family basic amino acid/polyamine antiporter